MLAFPPRPVGLTGPFAVSPGDRNFRKSASFSRFHELHRRLSIGLPLLGRGHSRILAFVLRVAQAPTVVK